MNRDHYWQLKIHAFLHDPPHKALVLFQPGWAHATLGRGLAERLAGRLPQDRYEVFVRAADRLASGADRANFLKPVETRFISEPWISHPLSGEAIRIGELTSLRDVTPERAHAAVERAIAAIAEQGAGDWRRTFFALWSRLGDLLARDRELGALWQLLPADTRLPDHGVLGHMSLTSALAGCLFQKEEAGEPALLLVTFGPVQPFIETSRRTRDLWAASTILAELAWAAAEPIVDELGPDVILFPWLAGESHFEGWIEQRFGLQPAPGRRLPDVPTLPNRLLVVLPTGRVQELARRAQAALRQRWRQIAGEARSGLSGWPAAFDRQADRQVDQYLEVSWASWPWPADEVVDGAPASMRDIFGGRLPGEVETWLEHAADLDRELAYRLNGGALYGATYHAAAQLLDARKQTRLFEAGEAEGGLKCTLCGQREVVSDQPGGFAAARAYWRKVQERLGERELRPGEALCAVCLMKRLWSLPSGDAGQPSAIPGQPSTSEVAVSDFKLDVLRHWTELARLAGEWVEAARAVDALAFAVHAVHVAARAAGNGAEEFARTDGQYLLRSARADIPGLPSREAARIFGAARSLIRAAADLGIPPPRPYLAVLHMDGDHMGRWLSGARAPRLAGLLAPAARAALRDQDMVRALLDLPRPLAPALHAAISQALACFDRRSVPQILRGRELPGHLVYAGGDDVLALLPLRHALRAALRVRLVFSGHLRGVSGDIGPDELGWEVGHGFARDRDGPYLALGRDATMSAGLAVFHHRQPLGRALAQAREAESFAKRRLGRNAFAVSVQRRSGSRSLVGAPWRVGPCDVVATVDRVKSAVLQGALSPRFLGELRQLALRLAPPSVRDADSLGLRAGIVAGQVRSTALGHMAPGLTDDDRRAIADAVATLASVAGLSSAASEPLEPETAGRLRGAVDLLDAAVFLAREGER